MKERCVNKMVTIYDLVPFDLVESTSDKAMLVKVSSSGFYSFIRVMIVATSFLGLASSPDGNQPQIS